MVHNFFARRWLTSAYFSIPNITYRNECTIGLGSHVGLYGERNHSGVNLRYQLTWSLARYRIKMTFYCISQPLIIWQTTTEPTFQHVISVLDALLLQYRSDLFATPLFMPSKLERLQ